MRYERDTCATLVDCGKASRSEKKRVDGDEGVKDRMQSSIAGMAAGGTRRKLLSRESIEVSIANTVICFNFSNK